MAVFIGISLAVGASGSGITAANIHYWYLSLNAPPLTPPNWLFGPVWGVLYVLMGVAAWLVWRQADLFSQQRRALAAWGWQLGINALWVPVFFGLHLMLPALGVLLALAGAIMFTIRRFWPLNRLAALLLLPYLAWAGFATYLNAGFWWLNH